MYSDIRSDKMRDERSKCAFLLPNSERGINCRKFLFFFTINKGGFYTTSPECLIYTINCDIIEIGKRNMCLN